MPLVSWSFRMYLNHRDFGSDARLAGGVRNETHPDYYDLGLACFSAAECVNGVEAHMWFNLAAMTGDRRGVSARAEVADHMSGREIAEAQRRARLYHVHHFTA
jgi:hypothetical protein